MPNTEVDFEFDGTAVRIVAAANSAKATRGARLNLRGRGDVKMTTEAIMALTRGE